MSRFFDLGRGVVARHGGTVEKFIGDALMAVFGVPHVHEDDALRAVRAALDSSTELEAVNDEIEASYGVRLALRTGVNTGEVAVGAGEVLATGDAVNVAARLEQLAAPGEILIARVDPRLVRSAVEVEPLEPVELKGKSARSRSGGCAGASRDVSFERRLDALLVGRERELQLLRDAYAARSSGARASSSRARPAGDREVAAGRRARRVGARPSASRAVPPVRQGITYWPLTNVVREAAGSATPGIGVDEAFAASGACSATTRTPGSSPTGSQRRPASAAAGRRRRRSSGRCAGWSRRSPAERPLILVFDDIHWAEPMFLDLVLHLADRVHDAPVLLVCMARPELLESRPDWARGQGKRRLGLARAAQPRADRAADRRAGRRTRAGRRACERIAASAEGNPLFVEEMLAILPEQGDGETGVPPTIQALLAARLDQLAEDERRVVEGGAWRRDAGSAIVSACHLAAPGRRRQRACRPVAAADPARADRPRRGAVPRRLGVPLPAPPDPGRGLPGDPQAGARPPPRALRRLAREGGRRPGRGLRLDHRSPPRRGGAIPT